MGSISTSPVSWCYLCLCWYSKAPAIPPFFGQDAAGYIGQSDYGFAAGSPLKVLLLQVAAHAVFWFVDCLWNHIGFGTLWYTSDPATFFGLFLGEAAL